MINRILTVALLVGLVAGIATSIVQHGVTVPVIIAAEAFEGAEPVAQQTPAATPAETAPAHDHSSMGHTAAAAGDHGAGGHHHDANAWAPADGIERIAFTTLSTVVASIGFALVLLAVMILANEPITPRRALAWGAGGFVAFSLAPAMGLAPELPGMEAAPVVARQAWWLLTVAATAGGLWLIVRGRSALLIVAGVALLIVPHLIGAPRLDTVAASAVPAELASRFAASVLGVAAIMWALIGAGIGLVWQRLDKTPT
ncbi:MAG: CbtA family protein [Labrys sp. (in: a-proteobacteria)]